MNASPLIELTQALKDCAVKEYGIDLSRSPFTVFGKLEAKLPGGSVKTRPAVQILRDAIASGRLRPGQVVFEATSGNFGIALGQMTKLGVQVVVLVSRKLQDGVLDELERSGVNTVNLDVDICPSPGMKMDPNLLVAKVVATNMRSRFEELGLDLRPFDASRPRFEELLARQDVINLAKALAEAYGGFCPSQYDTALNFMAHETVTGPEIEQQMLGQKLSLGDFDVVCTFGTGGTSLGLSRFVQESYGKKTVHVIFPNEGQEVAGIRTRATATGLSFYRPEAYAGQHEVDFQQAKRLLTYLGKKGLDIGESSALALYAVIQMVNFGVQSRFLVVLADGIEKYEKALEPAVGSELDGKLEVTLEEAKAHVNEYAAIMWTHPGYLPNGEGEGLVLATLNNGKSEGPAFEIASPLDVAQTVAGRQVPAALMELVTKHQGTTLVVCMSGNTSLRMAQAFSEKGVKAQSLKGGITNIAQGSGSNVARLVRPVP